MHRHRSRLVTSLLFLLGLSVPRLAAAQTDAASSSTDGSDNLIAIIGQVAHPGVYRAPFANPYLVDLVKNAGGFTDKATGYLRVIRRTPNGVEAMFASGRDFQLRPGDVVVAGGDARPVISPRPVQQAGGALEAAQIPSHVQLAFVNLADRPVVLKMRREHANLESILQSLGQSPAAAGSVKVISPVDNSDPVLPTAELASESVLVFDRAAIQVAQLPELPTAIANAAPPAQSDSPLMVHSDSLSERPGTPTVELPHPANENMTSVEVPLPPPLDLEPLFGPPPAPAATLHSQARPAAPRKPVRSAAVAAAPRIVLDDVDPGSDPLAQPAEAQADPVESSWFSMLMYGLLTLAGSVGAMWGYARKLPQQLTAYLLTLAVRYSRQSSLRDVSAAAVEPVDLAEPLDLDELIYDQLPIVEEPLAPVGHVAAHGPLSDDEPRRVDVSHDLHRPYYPAAAEVRDGLAAQTLLAEAQTASSDAAGTQHRFDVRHETVGIGKRAGVGVASRTGGGGGSAGLLDRVLSRVQGAAQQ